MRIEEIIWLRDVVDKLWSKHGVSQDEENRSLPVVQRFVLLKRAGEKVRMFTKRGQKQCGSLSAGALYL